MPIGITSNHLRQCQTLFLYFFRNMGKLRSQLRAQAYGKKKSEELGIPFTDKIIPCPNKSVTVPLEKKRKVQKQRKTCPNKSATVPVEDGQIDRLIALDLQKKVVWLEMENANLREKLNTANVRLRDYQDLEIHKDLSKRNELNSEISMERMKGRFNHEADLEVSER